MRVIDKLNTEYIRQLHELYKDVWFTQGREYNDIEKMLDNSYLTLGFVIDGVLFQKNYDYLTS